MASSVGIDVGGTKCLALRLDEDGGVSAREKIATPLDKDGLIEELATLCEQLADPGEPIGLGIPGLVDRDGKLWFGPNLGRMRDLPVLELMYARLGDRNRISVDNDATCHGWAEATLGAARGADVALVVTLGTGIGGSVIVGGKPFVGAHGFCGEFGHMLIDPRGPLCACGRRGCWEVFASGRGLGWMGREAAVAGEAPNIVALAGGDPEAVRGEHVTDAARAGDRPAIEVLERFGWWVAAGLAGLSQALDPDRIVIGGGIARSEDVVLEHIRAAFPDILRTPRERPEVPIVPARFGEDAGAVGAAVLARSAI